MELINTRIGVSIFQQLYPWASTNDANNSFSGGTLQHVETILNFARDRNKPVMIAESTPFGGIHNTTMIDDNIINDSTWKQWFEPVLNLIDTYDISMWSYINCDWDSQPMWHNVGFGETRVSTNAEVMKEWLSLVTNRQYGSRKFLMAGSLVDCSGEISSSFAIVFPSLRLGACIVSVSILLIFFFSLFLRSRYFHSKRLVSVNNEKTSLLMTHSE